MTRKWQKNEKKSKILKKLTIMHKNAKYHPNSIKNKRIMGRKRFFTVVLIARVFELFSLKFDFNPCIDSFLTWFHQVFVNNHYLLYLSYTKETQCTSRNSTLFCGKQLTDICSIYLNILAGYLTKYTWISSKMYCSAWFNDRNINYIIKWHILTPKEAKNGTNHWKWQNIENKLSQYFC